MKKSGRNMKAVTLVMMMAVLFCVFLCPHHAESLNIASGCESGIECLDLCDHHGPDHHHECELDGSHSHQYRNETSSLDEFVQVQWICVAILLYEAEQPTSFQFLEKRAYQSTHTYAVRHLDKIILRV